MDRYLSVWRTLQQKQMHPRKKLRNSGRASHMDPLPEAKDTSALSRRTSGGGEGDEDRGGRKGKQQQKPEEPAAEATAVPLLPLHKVEELSPFTSEYNRKPPAKPSPDVHTESTSSSSVAGSATSDTPPAHLQFPQIVEKLQEHKVDDSKISRIIEQLVLQEFVSDDDFLRQFEDCERRADFLTMLDVLKIELEPKTTRELATAIEKLCLPTAPNRHPSPRDAGAPLSEHDRALLAQFLKNPSENSNAWSYLARANLLYSPEDTQWLQNLADADVRTKTIYYEGGENGQVSLSVVAVKDYVPEYHPFSTNIPSTVLFLRVVYYQLFELVFARQAAKRLAVIGNPGTGKSWFHVFIIWYLLRIHKMKAEARPDLFLPTCIVQQLGFDLLQIYDLVNLRVWQATVDQRLLAQFNDKNTVYLFDPALHPESKPLYSKLRSIVTTSPKRDRIHEWMKDAGVPYYMPVWSEGELQIAAPWLCDALPADHAMKPLLAPDDVERRFEQFGGIIRHVLPLHPENIQIAAAAQAAAIKDVTFQQLFDEGARFDRRLENHSYHIFHYHVSSDLRSFRLRFSCRYVEIQLRARVVEVKFHDALEQLVQAMKGNLPERMRLLLETVTYGLLARDVDVWQVVEHIPYVRPTATDTLRFQLASVASPGMQCTVGDVMKDLPRQRFPQVATQLYIHTHDFPGVDEMKEDTLYIFGQTNFPFVEAIYKKDRVVNGIQCKSGDDFVKFSPSACLALRQLIRAEPGTPLVVWLVCTPRNVDKWQNAMTRGNYWAEPTDNTRQKDPSLWMQQHLAVESTVFSIVAHSLDQRDVTSGRMDEPTISAKGNQEPEVVVGQKRRRVEEEEPSGPTGPTASVASLASPADRDSGPDFMTSHDL